MLQNCRARVTRCSVALLAGLCTPLLATAGPSPVDRPQVEPEATEAKVVAQPSLSNVLRPADEDRAVSKKDVIDEHPDSLKARMTTAISAGVPVSRVAPPNDACADAIDVGMLPAVLLGDTTEATPDPEADAVGFCGTTPGAPGVWYTVMGTGNTITASLCSAVTAHDTKINIYCGDCVSGLICVAGNDDFCSLQSEISWCSEAGTTYYILVNGFGGQVGPFELSVTDDGLPCTGAVTCTIAEEACCFGDGSCLDLLAVDCTAQGGTPQGGGTDCATAVCPTAPQNDFCDQAIDVGPLPASLLGSTIGATPDDTVAPTCGTTVTAPGVWYLVTGTGNGLTASLCGGGTSYDSKISVYCGDCEVELFCVAGNDDFCSLQSEVSWCSAPGQIYYILVHGFSSAEGDFSLDVTDDGVACSTPPNCEPCQFACDPAFTPEGEATCMDEYVDVFNGGCNSIPPVFSDVDCSAGPVEICGTTGNFVFTDPVDGPLDSRDTDWYRFTLATEQLVTVTMEGGFNSSLVGIVNTNGIDDCSLVSEFLTSAVADECVVASVQALLGPGTWYVFASTADFVGVPCGSEYQLTITCEDPPAVACCFGDGTCLDLLPNDCAAQGGNPGALGSDCSTSICTTACCFADSSCQDLGVDDCVAAGGIVQGEGTTCADTACPPGNDVCATAFGPLMVPSSTIGTTIGATTDSDVESCVAVITSPGVWYTVIGTGNTMRASLCGGSIDVNDESKISVYCGDGCDSLFCVDGVTNSASDGCLSGPTEVFWCSDPGQEYFILVHGFGGNEFDFDLIIDDDNTPCGNPAPCAPLPPPANDLCVDAIGPLAIPSSTLGTTFGATVDSDVIECDEAIITSPGVWYTVVGNGNTITASICGGSVDVNDEAKISIYCGDCEGELFCAAGVTNFDADGCLTSPTEVSWCSAPGQEYKILVHGFGGNEFDFDLLLSDDATPCDNPPLCEPCTFACSNPNAIPEGEPTCGDEYNDMFNGGCNSDVPVFSDIFCGDVICGEAGTFLFTDPVDGVVQFRDTDWYKLVLTEPTQVTVSIEAGFDALLGIVDTGGVDDCLTVGGFLVSEVFDGCELGSISALLDAGTWYVFAAPAVFEGVACGTEYELSLECAAIGACCLPDPPTFRAPCLITTEADCVDNLKGIYLGDNSECGGFTYNAADCENGFEDISATGTNTFLGDEDSVLVPIGFNFGFYGADYAELYITDNGFVSFAPVPSLTFQNQDIPDPTEPNNLIAPLWNDFDPSGGGAIYYETLGTAPDRRFIVQWDQLPQFFDVDSNTFQCVLYESTGCVEFRYGLVTPEAFAGAYTIGVEDQPGFRASSVPGTAAIQGACIELCPEAGIDPCPKCIGDVDDDGDTDVFDYATLAVNFGQNVPPNTGGDLNGDGTVDIFDFMIIAADFGCGTVLLP
jgi:hypothetical protein